MGILDDAIREHLELKRTHGAPDDETRAKEVEAFGPVRQEAVAAPEAAVDDETQLLTPAEAPAAPADLEPLEPAPEDPYAVHPGDELVPDPDVPRTPPEPDVPPAADAGAGTFEPPRPESAPAAAPHQTDEHPALVDHDHIHSEEHPPEPVFRQQAEAPAAPAPEPVEEPLEPAPVEDPPVGDPPVEDDEDVLEETPEFLQDAPEHDRLWFEQRPPRDFDFGE